MANNTKGGGHTGSGNRPINSRAMQYASMRVGRVRNPGKKPAPPIPPSFQPLPQEIRLKLFKPVTKYKVTLEGKDGESKTIFRGSRRDAERTIGFWKRFTNWINSKIENTE